ncbi:SapC family protein [Rhizobium sp. C4]|uniref:SapC family protein n=1 Tax=Rhizobium sp. C4 TaxID=1349800 RepID=UPI001E2C5E23|nr:SapC family protein [Rhizobium sp. C4]MCD2172299.1 SapC family protein [Rhizobium sp. C4]
MATSATTAPDMQSNLPLFYSRPVVLRFEEHRKKALKPAVGFGFSATANAVPLLTAEFAHAARHYPIVFNDTAHVNALAVLGLKEGQNLFTATDGFWRAGTYVPAYLRRYPFIATHVADEGAQLLAIDSASDRFIDLGASDDAEPLFDDQGGPSPMTAKAMAFCHAFHRDHLCDQGFGAALQDQGLLVEHHAEMQFSDNSRYMLNGFRIVDAEKFRAISDRDLLLNWHQRGWLAAINLHLASMHNWEALLFLNAEINKTVEQGAA